MPGTESSPQLVIVDTDAVIAALYQGDASFSKATRVARFLLDQGSRLVFPVTTITETITTLIRKLNQPAIAQEKFKTVTFSSRKLMQRFLTMP